MQFPKKKFLCVLVLLVFALVSCGKEQSLRDRIKSEAFRNLKNYSFDEKSSLSSRVQTIPGFVLDHLKAMDNNPSYTPYAPSGKEMALLSGYLDMLPPLHKKMLRERLIGIYFVRNFQGSGMTEYVLNDRDDLYLILMLNPEVFTNDISKWLTYRENSCFIKNDPDVRVEVNSGNIYKGLMYVLLHETTHIMDYIRYFTPYPDPDLVDVKQIRTRSTDFTKGIWTEYAKPVAPYGYPLKDKVTFYGLNKGPKINISDALTIYRHLSVTPFVSIYGSQSWAEDFADFVTFYYLTQKLKQPYEIKYYKAGKLVLSYSPMKSPEVMKRFPLIKRILHDD